MRPARAAAVLAFALAGAASAGTTLFLTGEPAAAIDRAGAAWRGSGVVHSRFVDVHGRALAEEWLDLRTGATRRVEYEGRLKRSITVQRGSVITRWSSHRPRDVFRYEALGDRDPWLEHASQLLQVRRALAGGRARLVGQRMLDGTDVLLVRVAGASFHGGPAELIASLDRRSFMPRRFTVRGHRAAGSIDVRSDVLPSAGRQRLFASPTDWVFRARHLGYGDLPAAVPFTVYTPGRRHRSHHFGVAEQQEHASGGSAPGTAPELFIGYVADGRFGDQSITLSEISAETDDARARLERFQAGDRRVVSIDGIEREVLFLERRPGERLQFATVVGGTLVKGDASLPEDEVLRLLTRLEPARRPGSAAP